MQDTMDGETIQVLSLLGTIVFCGLLGNSLVLMMYARKDENQTGAYFIAVLAGVDLFVCAVVIPFSISVTVLNSHLGYDFLCQLFYFLDVANISFSSLMISAVAFERYACVCHPMQTILPLQRARILVLCLLVFAAAVGCGTAVNVALYSNCTVPVVPSTYSRNDISSHNNSSAECNKESKQCEEIALQAGASGLRKAIYKAIQLVNHFSFIVCILFVIFFYSLILRVVIRLRRGTQMLIARSTTAKPLPDQQQRQQQQQHILMEKSRRSRLRKASDLAQQRVRDNELFQNVRSAAMLFVAAVVYIVVFTPAILMASGIIEGNNLLFNLYYLNNAVNPFIYCFMNSHFRRELMQVICKRGTERGPRRCPRNFTLSEDLPMHHHTKRRLSEK